MFLLSLYQQKTIERSVYWNEYKTSENKNTTNNYRYFLESNFVGVNGLFTLVYSNAGYDAKRYNAKNYYLLKGIIKNYNIIVNEKNFNDQPIDSDINQYEKKKRKLATVQGEYYTAGCFLDCEYMKKSL